MYPTEQMGERLKIHETVQDRLILILLDVRRSWTANAPKSRDPYDMCLFNGNRKQSPRRHVPRFYRHTSTYKLRRVLSGTSQ
jgi:hypothetical protein